MKILGLDQSLVAFGWSVLEDGKSVEYGVIKSKLKGTARLAEIEQELIKICRENDLGKDAIIVMEGYSFAAKGRGIFNLGELGGVVRLWCWKTFGKEPYVVAPMTLKKFITGKGTGDKSAMMKCVFQKYDFDVLENNIVDAFALAKLGWAIYGYQQGATTFPKYEQECIERVLKIEEVTE